MILFLVLLLCTFWELCALFFNILLFTDKKKVIRGLRQGDSFFHFLFIIVVKVLSRMFI